MGLLAVSIAGLVGGCQNNTPATTQKTEPNSAMAKTHNQLSAEEKAQGWELMFDGHKASLWRGYKKDQLPNSWLVIDEQLHMVGEANMSAQQKTSRGDIVFNKPYENFHLKLEWKISKNGNSGIFYLGQENPDNHFGKEDYIWRTAPEMQILDNHGHPDANKGKDGNRQAGSLYDLIAAKPQNAKTPGQWNQVEIIVKNRQVSHRQNGIEVVSYSLDTEQWQQLVASSKFPELNPDWAKVAQRGFIGLQDHSDAVWFRNLKIKAL